MPVMHRPLKRPQEDRLRRRPKKSRAAEPSESISAQLYKEKGIPRAEAFRYLLEEFVEQGMAATEARNRANAELDKYYKKKK